MTKSSLEKVVDECRASKRTMLSNILVLAIVFGVLALALVSL